MILREAGMLAAFGVGLGLAASAAAGGLVRRLLFGVSPWDLGVVASMAALLAMATVMASFLPARRAARLDPVETLRAE
jgi:ABC-type antimicrobial peptide transport system permease subunit